MLMTFSATVSPLTGFQGVDWVLVNSVLPSPMASDLEANANVRRLDSWQSYSINTNLDLTPALDLSLRSIKCQACGNTLLARILSGSM